jgi:hypothetical protein
VILKKLLIKKFNIVLIVLSRLDLHLSEIHITKMDQEYVKYIIDYSRIKNNNSYTAQKLNPCYDYYVINPEFTEWLINETERLKNQETK